MDSATGYGVQRVGAQIRNNLLSQQAGVDQPADPPIEDRPFELQRFQPGQLKGCGYFRTTTKYS